MSVHGDVDSYYLPLEAFYEKYGFYPPKHPDLQKRKDLVLQGKKPKPLRNKHIKNWCWAKLTKEQYLDLKIQGISDAEIIEKIQWMNYERLHNLKKKWGMLKK